MSVPEIKSIHAIRGQSLFIDIPVPDDADLSGASIEFGIAENDSLPYIETLSTTTSGQTITADLSSEISLALHKSRYYFSCWLVIGGDPTPVARGYINIKGDSRNK